MLDVFRRELGKRDAGEVLISFMLVTLERLEELQGLSFVTALRREPALSSEFVGIPGVGETIGALGEELGGLHLRGVANQNR